jgi:hypothetical protein
MRCDMVCRHGVLSKIVSLPPVVVKAEIFPDNNRDIRALNNFQELKYPCCCQEIFWFSTFVDTTGSLREVSISLPSLVRRGQLSLRGTRKI